MQIVIKIPDEFIKGCNGNLDCVVSLVNGEVGVYSDDIGYTIFGYTILPKGHGRLIDVSELLTITDIRADGSEFTYVPYSEIEDAPTIVKADKDVDNDIL